MRLIDADALVEVIEGHVIAVSCCPTVDWSRGKTQMKEQVLEDIKNAPPVEVTFCGYKIQHLAAVATLLQQKCIMPETVGEFFCNLDGAVRIAMDEIMQHAQDEMEKTLAGMFSGAKMEGSEMDGSD